MMSGKLNTSFLLRSFLALIFLVFVPVLNFSSLSALPNPVVPGAFNLVEPLNGTIYNQWQEFQPWIWEIAPNATGYNFLVERIEPDSTVIFDQQNWMGFCEDGLCYNGFPAEELTDLTDGTYQWNVTARDGDDLTPSTNGPQTFVIDSTAVLPGEFNLWYPLDGEAFHNAADVTFFYWAQSLNATTMQFVLTEVSPTPGDLITWDDLTVINDDDPLNCETDYGGCELAFSAVEQELLVDGGLYEWRVTAYTEEGSFSAYGNPFTLKIDSTAILPGPFELWYPLADQVFNAGADMPFFKWRNAANSIAYDLYIDNPAASYHTEWTNQTPAADTDPLTCSERECIFTLDAATQTGLLPGDYQWHVVAHSEDSVSSTASAYFVINPEATLPGDFDLVNPPLGIIFQLPAAVTPLEWQEAADSLTYRLRFWRLNPDENVLIDLPALTPGDDTDQLTCAAGRCRFVLNTEQLALLSDGVFEWEAIAYSVDGFVPASNAVYQFALNSTVESLLLNGGMEDDTDADKVPDNWTGKLLTGDKQLCNKTDKIFAYIDTCAFRFKGNVNEISKLQQVVNLDPAKFNLRIGNRVQTLDELQLAFFVETKNATTGATVKLVVKYADTNLENGKLTYEVPAGSGLYTGTTQALTPAGDVAKVKLQLRFKNPAAGGKVYFDAIQLIGILPAGVLPVPANAEPLPLPDAALQSGVTGSR